MEIQKNFGMMMEFKYPPGATPIDHDEFSALIPKHIITQDILNQWEEENISDAREWVNNQKNIDLLSMAFIQKLHQKMFDKTWRWAGKFRLSEKNIGVHWSQIAIKLNNLCSNIHYQIDHQVYPIDEIAVRFHHELVSIHAFANGNGRHARLMTDLLLKKLGQQPFSWGFHQDLYGESKVRMQYIQALQRADKGCFTELIVFARS